MLQPGNHDVGQNPSAGNVAEYCARFGDDYFSFWVGGVKYISINAASTELSHRWYRLMTLSQQSACAASSSSVSPDRLSRLGTARRLARVTLAHAGATTLATLVAPLPAKLPPSAEEKPDMFSSMASMLITPNRST